MADLTLTQLAAKLPANSFTETADDVTISLKTLMGEASVQLADTKVAEFLSKTLAGAANAQVDYNTANPNAQLNSYPQPNFGVPTDDGNGNFIATRTHTLTAGVPTDLDEITGNPL
jgi:hypothetical protein